MQNIIIRRLTFRCSHIFIRVLWWRCDYIEKTSELHRRLSFSTDIYVYRYSRSVVASQFQITRRCNADMYCLHIRNLGYISILFIHFYHDVCFSFYHLKVNRTSTKYYYFSFMTFFECNDGPLFYKPSFVTVVAPCIDPAVQSENTVTTGDVASQDRFGTWITGICSVCVSWMRKY